MVRNPYKTTAATPIFTTKKGIPVSDLKGAFKAPNGKLRRSSSPLVGNNGEINAGSREDLIAAINGLLELSRTEGIHQHVDLRAQAEERAEILAEALGDRTGEGMKLLGEELSDVIWDHAKREGFLRRVMAVKDVLAGQLPRVRVRKNWTRAAVMGIANFKPFLAAPREQYYYPPEYYITCPILIEDKEISQTAGDLLTEKLEDGQERVQVQEDTVLKRLMDLSVSASGNTLLFPTFTPATFQSLRSVLQTRGVPAANCLLAGDLWDKAA